MKRETSLDIIRSIAIIFVLSVHFFLNTHFYQMNVKGFMFIVMIFLRTLFFTCVPLFLLLTGYLQNKKKLEKKYYKGIKRILISYLFISIICLFFNRFYVHQLGIAKGIIGIFNFKTDAYSWYIEMYIGLFLLIPFLNILYKNLKTKKDKQILILTLVGLVSLPSVFNYIKYKGLYLFLVPDWWKSIYPILYYFIGCYISEYKIKVNKKKTITGLTVFLLIITIALYLYNYNSTFSWYFLGDFAGLTTVISSTLLFLILYDLKIKSKIATKVFTSISILSLDIYLFSYISDKLVYTNIFIPKEIDTYVLLFIVTVPLSFALAYIMAYLKKILFYLLSKKQKNE